MSSDGVRRKIVGGRTFFGVVFVVALAIGYGLIAAEKLVAEEKAAATLYVATTGDDKNQGTEQKPFASLAKAKDAVRELKKKVKGPITVLIHKGTYYFSEPLVFQPADSGSAEQPIKYAACPGESVTLSGGRKLECNWQPYQKGIMQCSLPEAKDGKLVFTQLFVNGKRQISARYPNYDAKNPFPEGGGYINMARKSKWPATEFAYDPATFTKNRWAKPSEAVVHTFPETFIGSLHWQVKDVDWSANAVKLGVGGFQMNDVEFGEVCSGIGQKSRFYIENVFEELDAPGEWYLDRAKGILYYMPAEDVDLKSALVEAPILRHLVEFKGSQTDPVKRITLQGFRIAHTASTFLEVYETTSKGDWTIHRGGTVFIEGAEDSAIDKCFFDAIGGNAIFVNNYNRRITISNSKFTETGDSAICIAGTRCKSIGSNMPYPAENVISNNLIHDCGAFGKQIAGVFLSTTISNTICHNEMYALPRAGIEINDGWWGGHLIEFNTICDTDRETSDHGSINSWGREKYWCMVQSHGPGSHILGSPYLPGPDARADAMYTTVIRNNFFREKHEWSIDMDDGTSNYHLYNNVSVGCSIKAREGDFRVIENNIILYPHNQFGFEIAYEDNQDVFRNNIIVTSIKPGAGIALANIRPGVGSELGDIYAHIWPPLKGRMAKEVDYNLFHCDSGQFFSSVIDRSGDWNAGTGRKRYTLPEWQALGYDQHSLFADPMFVDPTIMAGASTNQAAAEPEFLFDGLGGVVKTGPDSEGEQSPYLTAEEVVKATQASQSGAATGDKKSGIGNYQVKPESPALKLGFKNFDLSTAGLLPDFPKEWRTAQ